MSLIVHTARVSSRDPDRLDVTRKSGTSGLFLAPSWATLLPAIRARGAFELKWAELEESMERDDMQAERHLACELGAAKQTWVAAWSDYKRAYLDEMRRSYVEHRAQWVALLARPRVVLCCYCTDSEHCHRTLLARDILPKLGATNGGEL